MENTWTDFHETIIVSLIWSKIIHNPQFMRGVSATHTIQKEPNSLQTYHEFPIFILNDFKLEYELHTNKARLCNQLHAM